jgi:hypothetical protein
MEKVALKPSGSRLFEDGQPVTDQSVTSQDLAGYFTPEEWATAAKDDISLDDVRRALSTISGSFSEAIVALRQER